MEQPMDIIGDQEAIGIHFQEEIIMDILSRLPVQSLLRFQSVSRFWKTLIVDSYFKIKHLTHAKNDLNSQKFLVCQWGIDEKDAFDVYCPSLLSAQLSENVPKPDFPSNFPSNGYLWRFLMYCCCDGLVLLAVADEFDEHLLLWNPSTRESIVLPHPESSLIDYICGMEYDTSSDDYKILMINQNVCVRDLHEVSIEILVLKSGYWRKIGKYPTRIYHVLGFMDCGMDSLAFVHGAFHWLGSSQGYTVVSFSISNEVYREIPLVDGMCNILNMKFNGHGVSVLGEMLCYYSTYICGVVGNFKLWVMKDYGVKESWTELFTMRDINLLSARPKYRFVDGEVLLCCKYSTHVGRVFRTSKGPFGLCSQFHDFWAGFIYTESLMSPKLLA